MANQKYNLNKDEKIVFKISGVRHGFCGAYTDTLVVTNQCVILEKYGIFNKFKGIERYHYKDIKQAIEGVSQYGDEQLELYIGNEIEEFLLQSDNENELRILVMSINDQMGPDGKYYDFKYYKDLLKEDKDIDRLIELRKKINNEENEDSKTGLAFIGDVTKNVIKSGDFSIMGVTKGINKATKKQKRKGIINGFMDEFLDDIGIRDIQDEFIEIGNEFREEFGLKPKVTHAERRELKELEEQMEKKKAKQSQKKAMDKKITQQKKIIEEKKKKDEKKSNNNEKKTIQSVNEQLDALKKAKELLDAGILTQEEFEQKKKEILDN